MRFSPFWRIFRFSSPPFIDWIISHSIKASVTDLGHNHQHTMVISITTRSAIRSLVQILITLLSGIWLGRSQEVLKWGLQAGSGLLSGCSDQVTGFGIGFTSALGWHPTRNLWSSPIFLSSIPTFSLKQYHHMLSRTTVTMKTCNSFSFLLLCGSYKCLAASQHRWQLISWNEICLWSHHLSAHKTLVSFWTTSSHSLLCVANLSQSSRFSLPQHQDDPGFSSPRVPCHLTTE